MENINKSSNLIIFSILLKLKDRNWILARINLLKKTKRLKENKLNNGVDFFFNTLMTIGKQSSSWS